MNANAQLPRAARPFVEFPGLLRTYGFAVAPEQTTTFLAAIELLGPRSIGDIRRAAVCAALLGVAIPVVVRTRVFVVSGTARGQGEGQRQDRREEC